MKYWNCLYIFNYADYECLIDFDDSWTWRISQHSEQLFPCMYIYNSCTFFAFETFAENFKYKCNKFSLYVVSVTETQHNRYICRLAIVCSLFTSLVTFWAMNWWCLLIFESYIMNISCIYLAYINILKIHKDPLLFIKFYSLCF